jgi:hypothetical protein
MNAFRIFARWTAMLGLAVVFATCAQDPVNPEDFVLTGTWMGTLNSTDGLGAFGSIELTLVGQHDGETEEYGGEGLLTGTQVVRRFSQVQADYNTVDRTLTMTILDLSLGAVYDGVYNGTSLFIADSTVCRCEALLAPAS